MSIFFTFFVIVFSVYIMKKCSSVFDIASSYLTKNLAEGIKGPTINAVASSLPELFISSMFLFYFKDLNGFSAGFATIIGSSAFNIAIIPTVSFLFVYSLDKKKIFKVDKVIIKQDVVFLLCSIIILMMGLFFGMNAYVSALLILFYLLYIFFIIINRSKNKIKQKTNKNFKIKKSNYIKSVINLNLFNIFFKGQINIFSSIIVLILSIFLIGISCFYLVVSVEKVSHFLNINIFFGAFIIAAIASSIPDTLLSIEDAKNDKFSDSFSNAFGSNIFDICIGIGLPVLCYNLLYSEIDSSIPIERMGIIGNYIFNGDLFLWSLVSLLLFTFLTSIIYYFKQLNLKTSIVIIFLYLLFVTSLILF